MFFIMYFLVVCVLSPFVWRKLTADLWQLMSAGAVLLLISVLTVFASFQWDALQYQPSIKQYYRDISKQLPSFKGTVECEGLNPVLKGTQSSTVSYNNNIYLVSYEMRYDQLTGASANSSWYGLCPLGFVPTVNAVVSEASNITSRITATAEYILIDVHPALKG